MTGVLDRTAEHRLAALCLANEVRSQRARMKRRLRGNEVSVIEIVRCPPDYVRSMKLHQLLLALPTFGPRKVRQLLARIRISDAKTIGGLSPRQRDEIILALVRCGCS